MFLELGQHVMLICLHFRLRYNTISIGWCSLPISHHLLLLQVQGRQMRMESITFGKGGHQSAGPTADWSRAVMANNVIKAIDMEKWAVFYVRPNHNDVQNFVDEMQRVSLQLGIHYSRPELIQLRDDKVETLLNNLRRSVNPAVSDSHTLQFSASSAGRFVVIRFAVASHFT